LFFSIPVKFHQEVVFQIKGNGLWCFYSEVSLCSLIDVGLRGFFSVTKGKGISQTCCLMWRINYSVH